MTDYIRKQDAIDMLQKHAERLTHQTNISLSNVRSGVMTAKWLIEDMSTADVRENVRGEWIEVEVFPEVYDIEGIKTWGSEMQCDQCGFRHTAIEGHMTQYNFCPNCGADMRPISALSENVEIASNLKRGES